MATIDSEERKDRLHNEIIDWIDNIGLVEKHSKELYNIVKENPNNPHDLMLLYQTFCLLQDEEKRMHCEKMLRKFFTDRYEFIKNQSFEEYNKTLSIPNLPQQNKIKNSKKSPEELKQDINKMIEAQKKQDEDTNLRWKDATIKEIVYDHLPEYLQSSSYFKRVVLWHYCFDDIKEYDDYVDVSIIYLTNMYFKHNHPPKDLFHTDHAYIIDAISLDMKKDMSLSDDDDIMTYYAKVLEIPQFLPQIDLTNFAKYSLNSVQIAYRLRNFYPKKEYNKQQDMDYFMERILFDRVLFNDVTRNDEGMGTSYYEPEGIMQFYLSHTLTIRSLKKSEWIGLYFASKELELDRFQSVFYTKTKKRKAYEAVMWDNLSGVLAETSLFSQEFLDAFHNTSYFPALKDLESMPDSLTNHHKLFIKGLLFICMWEKFYFRNISQKHLDDLSNQKQDDKSLQDVYEEIVEYRFNYEMDLLFKNEPIENLSKVFKKATKYLNMSEEGLDFSFFNLEGEIEDPEDIIMILFNFSRIERESTPYMVNFLNLLRERQKAKYPLDEDYIIKNHEKIKQIDVGFTVQNFEVTLEPIRDVAILKNSDIDNRFIYVPKTVKFVCETDMDLVTNKKKVSVKTSLDFFEKALDSIYLYKIRNQLTHFSADKNIEQLIKNPRDLLLILIKVYFKYFGIVEEILKKWEGIGVLKRMLRTRPHRVIPPFYIVKHTSKLIQFLCLIISIKNKDKFTEEELKELHFTYINDDWIRTLETLRKFVEKTEDKKFKLDIFKDLSEEQKQQLFKLYLEELYDLKPENRDEENFKDHMDHHSMLLFRYVNHIDEITISLLNFAFSSQNQIYGERTQLNTFLHTYHGESAYYMLYLAQHFCKGFQNNK